MPEITDWKELKDLLRLSFGKQRHLDCLVQEMTALKVIIKTFTRGLTVRKQDMVRLRNINSSELAMKFSVLRETH